MFPVVDYGRRVGCVSPRTCGALSNPAVPAYRSVNIYYYIAAVCYPWHSWDGYAVAIIVRGIYGSENARATLQPDSC
jgi:hypothetical protein